MGPPKLVGILCEEEAKESMKGHAIIYFLGLFGKREIVGLRRRGTNMSNDKALLL